MNRKIYAISVFLILLTIVFVVVINNDKVSINLENYNDENYVDKEYNIGDVVQYNGEDYHVISYSDSDQDYVTVMKDEPLKEVDMIIDESKPGYAAYNGCEYSTSECNNDYNRSIVKVIVDNWTKNELDENDLVSIDGYKSRLIKIDELIDNLGYEVSGLFCGYNYLESSEDTPNVFKNYSSSAWTMSGYEDSTSLVTVFQNRTNSYTGGYQMLVIPVININRSILKHSEKYNIGDEITYKDDTYYVMNDNINDNYVTVLKANPLNEKQIINYGKSMYARIYYSGTDYKYDGSNVKAIIDNWEKNNFNKGGLINIDGYTSRLINIKEEEIQKKLVINGIEGSGFEFVMRNNTIDSLNNEYGYLDLSRSYIRPVINLNKSFIGKYYDVRDCSKKVITKKIKRYNEFKIGNKITYKDEDYYVIENSSNSKNYVVLLKDEPLLDDYNNDSGKVYIENPYFYNESCNSNNTSGCTNNYNQSNIKTIVDNWIVQHNIENDLVSIRGYKARLLTINELIDNLGYIPGLVGSIISFVMTEDTPDFIYNNSYNYWTMSGYEDSNNVVYIFVNNNLNQYLNNGASGLFGDAIYDSYMVRPIINLKKYAFEGGCNEEEIEVEDGCIDDVDDNITDNLEEGIRDDIKEDDNNLIGNVIVTVANTLKYLPQIIIIISSICILIGLSILGYNYYKSKKERR